MKKFPNPKIKFFVPLTSELISGGTLYNLKVFQDLLNIDADIKLEEISLHHKVESRHIGNHEDVILVDGLLLGNVNFIHDTRKKVLILHGPHLPKNLITKPFTHIVLVSEDLKSRFIANVGKKPITVSVISPGTDHFSYGKSTESPPHSMCTIGAITPDKDQGILVDALASVSSKKWQLHMIGSCKRNTKYYQYIIERIRKYKLNDNITIHGELNHPQIFEIFLKTNLYIVSSPYESFGITAFEALNAGIPVLNCSDGFLKKAIGHRQGWQVPYRCPVNIARFITLWLEGKIPHINPMVINNRWIDAAYSYKAILDNL